MMTNVTSLIEKMKLVSSMSGLVAQQLPTLVTPLMTDTRASMTAQMQPALTQAAAVTAQMQAAIAAQATQSTQLQQQSQRLTQAAAQLQRQAPPPRRQQEHRHRRLPRRRIS